MSKSQNNTSPKSYRNVQYIPPSSKILDQYARAVCNRLYGKAAPTSDIQDFRSFMQVVAQITAKQKNKECAK